LKLAASKQFGGCWKQEVCTRLQIVTDKAVATTFRFADTSSVSFVAAYHAADVCTCCSTCFVFFKKKIPVFFVITIDFRLRKT